MKAKPIEDCLYPNCEECDKYHGKYCTVPIVVNKQIFFMLGDKIETMDNSIKELEKLVMDEILGTDEVYSEPYVLTKEEYDKLPPFMKWWCDNYVGNLASDFTEKLP